MSILTYPLGFIGGGKEFYNNVIENSLRFEDVGDSYLFKTDHGTSTSTGIVTFSCWVKRGILTDDTTIIFGTKSSTAAYLRFNADDGIYCNFFNTGYNAFEDAGVYRDPAAWYHICANADILRATAGSGTTEVHEVWVNGRKLSSTNSSSLVPTGQTVKILETGGEIFIGRQDGDSAHDVDGYMTDMYVIDGHALGPENFGEYKEGVWIPKAYAGPPPIITDSSSSGHFIGNGSGTNINTTKLNYDKYYIGESSLETGGDGTAIGIGLRAQGGNGY